MFSKIFNAVIFTSLFSLTQFSLGVTITSKVPGVDWEQAMVSGNGNQGVMVPGQPQKEKIVINHTKLWVPAQNAAPDVPNIIPIVATARTLAKDGDYEGAASALWTGYYKENQKKFTKEDLVRDGRRLGYNYVHPAGYLEIHDGGLGEAREYTRTCDFETGEITTRWTDDAGTHMRQVFCDRVNDVIVVRLSRPDGQLFTGSVALVPRLGWNPKDISDPIIEHTARESSLSAKYLHRWGREYHDGYQTSLRVLCDGMVTAKKQRTYIKDASQVLLVLHTNYLDDFSKPAPAIKLPSQNYSKILAEHSKIHGELFNRVSLDFGGSLGAGRSTEEIIAEAEEKGPTPAYLELIHASGRYCLISSSGVLPPTLMGIWGDTWNASWWGHYTLDSNLQLAVANGNVGNLPESMESFFNWIETLYPSWERNAKQFYGARGYQGAIAHGWRHGIALGAWHEWTGCSAWMATFFWQSYLFTGDLEFLEKRTIPLLENVALFYQDFLKGQEDENGKFFIYPSISPENSPEGFPMSMPNATSEIALIHETFNALIKAYKILDIKKDQIPHLESFLSKVPPYRINEDGALAEWAYPEIPENYNHRHNSHLIALYPGTSINPSTPKLYQAAKNAIAMRLKAGQGNKSAHGYMELGFAGSRLQDPSIVWNMLSAYSREKFINSAFISSHNPDHKIYNLDSILALPAIFTEMCLYSYEGHLNLLPGIPQKELPKGSIKGILARTGIVINELSWDLPKKTITLSLTSKTTQTVALSSPLDITSEKNVDLESGKPRTLKVRIK